MLDQQIVLQRLAFIKYLYIMATEQSKQPEPISSAAILTFHDSVELFLQLSFEHLDVGGKEPKFMEYWEVIIPKLPPGGILSQKESMRRLNASRVAMKHHGTLPSKQDIESFRASVANFFEDNTPLIFGNEFKAISMVDLVACDNARECLIEAAAHMENDDIGKAMECIAIAFAELLRDYESRKRNHFGASPFFFGQSLAFENSFFMGVGGTMASFVDKVKDSIETMQSAMKILSLGLDYRRYAKFRLYTPIPTMAADGAYHIQYLYKDPGITIEECQFCYDFVISSAIRLQEFDFEV